MSGWSRFWLVFWTTMVFGLTARLAADIIEGASRWGILFSTFILGVNVFNMLSQAEKFFKEEL